MPVSTSPPGGWSKDLFVLPPPTGGRPPSEPTPKALSRRPDSPSYPKFQVGRRGYPAAKMSDANLDNTGSYPRAESLGIAGVTQRRKSRRLRKPPLKAPDAFAFMMDPNLQKFKRRSWRHRSGRNMVVRQFSSLTTDDTPALHSIFQIRIHQTWHHDKSEARRRCPSREGRQTSWCPAWK